MLPHLDLEEVVEEELELFGQDIGARVFTQRLTVNFSSAVDSERLGESIPYSRKRFRRYLNDSFYLGLFNDIQKLYIKCKNTGHYNEEIKTDFEDILNALEGAFNGNEN